MMRQDYTLFIYKADRRVKTGERTVSITVWRDRDEASMKRECAELFGLYPASQGYRIEYHPRMEFVNV